ncbi:MAG: hypothetical protein HY286_04695 [Planctomycetes bacterium]|nr:hypothetical protein [Planctomycetota bacterium]
MNPKMALALLIVAILLGAGTLYLVLNIKTFDDRSERDVFDFSVPKVTKITAKRGADTLYEIAHEKDRWIYKFPAIGEADASKVVRAISDLRFDARIMADVTAGGKSGPLEEYGFGGSRLEVDIYTPGKNYIFQIGNATATKDGVYVRLIPGDRVLVTTPKVSQLFDVAPDYFKSTAGGSAGPK